MYKSEFLALFPPPYPLPSTQPSQPFSSSRLYTITMPNHFSSILFSVAFFSVISPSFLHFSSAIHYSLLLTARVQHSVKIPFLNQFSDRNFSIYFLQTQRFKNPDLKVFPHDLFFKYFLSVFVAGRTIFQLSFFLYIFPFISPSFLHFSSVIHHSLAKHNVKTPFLNQFSDRNFSIHFL
jgi:hypothetical protein